MITRHSNFSFAVGFSRQPLPKGNRFAKVTNADGSGVRATDATICYGLELAKLRPETLESLLAKLPPTANFFSPDKSARGFPEISIADEAGARDKNQINGVKQKLPCVRLVGVEFETVMGRPANQRSTHQGP